jgi:hypothetical protein
LVTSLKPLLFFASKKIPAYESLERQLRNWWIPDPNLDLSEIRELIANHVRINLNYDPDFESPDDMEIEAMNTAFHAIDELIEELEVNLVNYLRLKKYIREVNCHSAYNRLLTDFSDFLRPDELREINNIEARRIFIPEVTRGWPEDVRNGSSIASLLLQGIIKPIGDTPDGKLIEAIAVPWEMIVDILKDEWEQAFRIPPDKWEELIAAAFDRAGYDEVVLTPVIMAATSSQ